MDLMPTILDLAGAQHPAASGKPSSFQGQSSAILLGTFHSLTIFTGRTVQPMKGKSWTKWFKGQETEVHDAGVPMGWELHGRAALRIGDYKVLWMRKLRSRLLIPSQVAENE